MDEAGKIASTTDRARAIATIVAAFIADPVTRWAFPDLDHYLKAMPGIIEAFADGAFEKGSAYAYAKLRAAALWLGPGIEPDGERMSEILEATVSPEMKDDLLGFSEKQSSNHPHEAHWYLAMIGVDPAYQGRGLGGALLNHGLAISDKSGLPSYLEATSVGNRRLYERHGFVVVNEIQYGSSSPMWGMWREAR